jgi:hypothetical protein
MNAVLLVYVLVCAIVVFVDRNIDYSLRSSNVPLLPNLALLAIAVVGVILFHKLVLQRRTTTKEPAHAGSGRGVAIIATAALFCYQLVSFYNVGFLTGWDAGTVREAFRPSGSRFRKRLLRTAGTTRTSRAFPTTSCC